MFETSLDLLYGAIAIGVLLFAGFLSYVLFRTGKIIEESQKSVETVNKNLSKLETVVDDVIPTIREVNMTVRDINSNIVKPVTSIGQIFRKFRSIAGIFSSHKSED